MSSEMRELLSGLARGPATPLDIAVVRRRATTLRVWTTVLTTVVGLAVVAGGVSGWQALAGRDEATPPVGPSVECEEGHFEALAVYLRDDATEDEIRFLLNQLSADLRVRAVYSSPSHDLLAMRIQYRDEREFWRYLSDDVFPARIDLYIHGDHLGHAREVAAVAMSHPVVEAVDGISTGRRRACKIEPDSTTTNRSPRPTTRQHVIAEGKARGRSWTFAAYRATTSRERNELGSHLCYGFWWGDEDDIECYSDAAKVGPGLHSRGGGWGKADLWRLWGPSNAGQRRVFVAAVSQRVERVELSTNDPSATFRVYQPPAELALPFRVVIAFSELGGKLEILAFDRDGGRSGLTNRGWRQ